MKMKPGERKGSPSQPVHIHWIHSLPCHAVLSSLQYFLLSHHLTVKIFLPQVQLSPYHKADGHFSDFMLLDSLSAIPTNKHFLFLEILFFRLLGTTTSWFSYYLSGCSSDSMAILLLYPPFKCWCSSKSVLGALLTLQPFPGAHIQTLGSNDSLLMSQIQTCPLSSKFICSTA